MIRNPTDCMMKGVRVVKLSPEIIFYRLLKNMYVCYLQRSGSRLSLGRPVLFSSDNKLSDSLVVLTAAEFNSMPVSECCNSAFIFVGKPDTIKNLVNCSVLCVMDSNVSINSLLNAIQNIYNLFDEWERVMEKIYYENRGFIDLVNCCESVIYDPICILDAELHFAAYSKLSYYRGLVDEFVESNQNVSHDVVDEFIAISKDI